MKLTYTQSICMAIALLTSNALIVQNTVVGQDSWLVLLCGCLLSLGLILLYLRILHLYPTQSLHGIIHTVFGRVAGFVINIAFVGYAVVAGSLALRSFTELMVFSAANKTPQWLFALPLLILCGYLLYQGMHIAGRFAAFAVPIVLFLLVFSLFVAFGSFSPDYLLPMLTQDPQRLGQATVRTLCTPFGEIVLLTTIPCVVNAHTKKTRIFLIGALLACAILLVCMLRNLLLLGPDLTSHLKFASYTALSTVGLPGIINRIEIFCIAIYFVLILIKLTICAASAAEGLQAALQHRIPKIHLIVGICIVLFILAMGLFETITELSQAVDQYAGYALLFQFALPLIIWVGAEIKTASYKRLHATDIT